MIFASRQVFCLLGKWPLGKWCLRFWPMNGEVQRSFALIGRRLPTAEAGWRPLEGAKARQQCAANARPRPGRSSRGGSQRPALPYFPSGRERARPASARRSLPSLRLHLPAFPRPESAIQFLGAGARGLRGRGAGGRALGGSH